MDSVIAREPRKGSMYVTTERDIMATPVGDIAFVNVNSEKVLEVRGGLGEEGARVSQGADEGKAHQRWRLTEVPGKPGAYTVENVGTGKVLDVENEDQGAHVIQRSLSKDEPRQQWEFEPTPADGVYRIKNSKSGKVVDVSRGRKDNDAPIEQYFPGDHPDGRQEWKFVTTRANGRIPTYNALATGLPFCSWEPVPEEKDGKEYIPIIAELYDSVFNPASAPPDKNARILLAHHAKDIWGDYWFNDRTEAIIIRPGPDFDPRLEYRVTFYGDYFAGGQLSLGIGVYPDLWCFNFRGVITSVWFEQGIPETPRKLDIPLFVTLYDGDISGRRLDIMEDVSDLAKYSDFGDLAGSVSVKKGPNYISGSKVRLYSEINYGGDVLELEIGDHILRARPRGGSNWDNIVKSVKIGTPRFSCSTSIYEKTGV